ncbi:MAG: flagellar protein FlgN [Synergistales bacterium]|nr:flagellar protein FlgN [Synergistales bacterium]
MTASLSRILEEQAGALEEMWGVVVEQREALKAGRLSSLQELQQRLQKHSFRARTLEAEREKQTNLLAARRGCEPTVSAIAETEGGEAARELRERADRLSIAVRKLQSEMQILKNLIEESAALHQVMIDEWRRVERAAAFRGGMDFRG